MDNGDIDQNPGGRWAGDGQRATRRARPCSVTRWPSHEHEQDDPRPVFEGDWQSASGVEKGQHSERVRQWRKRQEAKGLRRSAEPSGQPERDTQAAQAAAREADLATLDAIIAAPKALASDKIRAVEARQRILARKEAEAQADAHGPLIALRNALDAVPTEQRVDALHALVQVDGEAERQRA